MQQFQTAIKRFPVVSYLILSFGFSWVIQGITFWTGADRSFSYLGLAGPALAGLALIAMQGGKAALGQLIMRLAQWRFNPIWYFFILLYMPVLLLAALGVSFVINGRLPVLANLDEWTALPILFAQVIFVGGPLMDELGWRGFFQPALEKQFGKLYAGLLTALTACLWLIPFFAVNHLPVLEGALLTFGIQMLCAFVYDRSRGSLLPTVLLQGVVRATLLFFPFLPGAVESRLPLQAAAALVLAASLAVTLMVNQDRLPRFAPLQRSAQPHPLGAD